MDQIDIPSPGRNEVLIRVNAAGVGPWDAWIRAGKSAALLQPLPLTLGSDVSGVVESVGTGVSVFAPGDAVFGVTNKRFTGGYAEYAVVSVGMIALKPTTLGDNDAASVPMVAVTALQMLFDHAGVKRGQTVFVHGAAGNVGAYAVQLARRRNVHVIASAFVSDSDYVFGLGANEVVDTRDSRFADFSRSSDVVIDTVGGESQEKLFGLAKPGGIVVSSVSQPNAELARQYDVRAKFVLVDVRSIDLVALAEMFDTYKLTATVGTILSLDDARAAHEMLEGKRSHRRGKIVLEVR